MLLVALLGAFVAFLAPAQPARADDVNCYEEFVIDPTLCDDDLPPPESPPPPPPGPSNPGRGGMVEMPGGPGMNPGQTGEVCIRERNFADTAVIRQAGQRDKPIYTFTLRVNYCTRNGVVSRVSVIPGQEREPFDSRVRSITLPAIYRGPNGQGTPRFDQGQDVLTEFCPDGVNCQMYRHIFEVEIIVGDPRELRVVPDLFPCGGSGQSPCG
jgi:hypothetical protein